MDKLPAEQTWMVLVDLLTDLRKNAIEIPAQVTEDIRMARTTINFYKVDPTDPERMNEIKRINDFLNSAQDSLLSLAEGLGAEYSDEWLEKLKKASRGETLYPVPDKRARFVPGTPSGFTMVRLTFKEPLSEDRLVDIAEYHNIIIEFEEDHVIVVYGDKENIKKALKELSSFFQEQI